MVISAELVKVAHLDALQNVLTGFVLLTIALIALVIAGMAWRRFRKSAERDMPGIVMFIALLCSACFWAISLFYLLNLWNWVGLAHPTLYALHQKLVMMDRSRPLL